MRRPIAPALRRLCRASGLAVFAARLLLGQHARDYSFVYASQWIFSRELHSADYSWDIDQVTTSLLHQLGGYPKEATSKVRSARQLKVDSGRTFARSSGILRV
jgi:hypothetical protein